MNHPKNPETASVKILENKFAGIIYSYDRLDLKALSEEPPRLSFTYIIHEGKIDPNDEKEFQQIIGDYLVDIITLGENAFRRE